MLVGIIINTIFTLWNLQRLLTTALLISCISIAISLPLDCHIFTSFRFYFAAQHFHFWVSSLSTVVVWRPVSFAALDNIANNFLFYVDYFLDTLRPPDQTPELSSPPSAPLQPFLLTSFSFVPLPSRSHHILMWKGFGGIVFWLFFFSSSSISSSCLLAPGCVLCFKLFSRDLQFVILWQSRAGSRGNQPQDSLKGDGSHHCELRRFPNAIAALALNYPA